MSWTNKTSATEFWLLGFQNVHKNLKIPLFILLLALYVCILSGNLLIIALVLTSRNLKSPMYFFLANLSWADIVLTTVVIPNMLSLLLENRKAISFSSCMTQIYLFSSSAGTEIFLLTVMSYDRYLAICNPLRYLLIMDFKLQGLLVMCSWVLGFLLDIITVSQMILLRFCGPNVMNHFLCDPILLMELSCSDTSGIELQNIIFGIPITLFPLSFIFVTYIYILLAILKISSSTGKQKAFSTCSSHLAVVCIFYLTLITLYVFPSKGFSGSLTKVQSLLYTMATPLLNPLIYSLRNKDIQSEIKKLVYIKK